MTGRDNTVVCAGERERDYESVSKQEIEVLSGLCSDRSSRSDRKSWSLTAEPVLPQRGDPCRRRGQSADLSRIGSGQGFLDGADQRRRSTNMRATFISNLTRSVAASGCASMAGSIEKYVLDRSSYASLVNQVKIMARSGHLGASGCRRTGVSSTTAARS